MISIQKIALQELEVFVNSDSFRKLKNKPISKARALSYARNPRANKNDIVLYMAFDSSELVGYRTILSDFFIIENNKESFGWLSGNWVNPLYRREGISTMLFNEVFEDWNHKLMYTNYAEASKLVYDKTSQFEFLHELKGVKYYNRFCFADILPKKRKIFQSTKLLLKVIDFTLNLFFDIRYFFISVEEEEGFFIKENEIWNESTSLFLEKFISQNLFQRAKKEFDWIQSFPWVKTDKNAKVNSKFYYFSSYSKNFESNIYTVYKSKNKLIAFLLISVRDGHMKIPYAYFFEENVKEISTLIVNKCISMKVKTIIVNSESLQKELNTKLSFIWSKSCIQKHFATKKIFSNHKKLSVQSGDGDVVFT